MKITLQGGRVIDPANKIDERIDVHVAAGQIAALGNAPDGFSANRVIDVSGQIVCPGFIDLGARLREPGDRHKATIASETAAAASGGITTLVCPPDTNPVADTPAVIELIRTTAEQAGKARILPTGAITQGLEGKQLSEIAALKEAGCVAVSNIMQPYANTQVQRRAFEYAATFGLSIFIHPMDQGLAAAGCAHEGAISTRMGLTGIPEAAETMAVARNLVIIEQTGVRAHFARLSSVRAAQMISRARYDGLPITADVAAHQLFLTEHDIWQFNSDCHVIPPLRSDRDRDGLRDGLAQGVVQCICSDHQPHEADAKLAPFPSTEPGISALETLLPLTLRMVTDGVLGLGDAIATISSQAASVLGIDSGNLSAGNVADICVFDPEREWVLNEDNLVSHGLNTPFLGWHLKGRVSYTLLAGRPVYELNDD